MKEKKEVAKCPHDGAAARRATARNLPPGALTMSYEIRPSTTDRRTTSTRRHLLEAAGGAAGALGGAALGSMAGPPGAAAGAVIGGIVGALASAAVQSEAYDISEHDAELDAELGISEGDIGAPNLEHPPAERGAFSAANSGADVVLGEPEPASGPMPSAD
jgi:hypothetical protein